MTMKNINLNLSDLTGNAYRATVYVDSAGLYPHVSLLIGSISINLCGPNGGDLDALIDALNVARDTMDAAKRDLP